MSYEGVSPCEAVTHCDTLQCTAHCGKVVIRLLSCSLDPALTRLGTTPTSYYTTYLPPPTTLYQTYLSLPLISHL